jgi:amidohydrolase
MDLRTKIQTLARDIHQEVIATRHHLHANPELSYQEQKTSAYVRRQLQLLGIPVETGYADHGLVGLIEGEKNDEGNKEKVVALRADMDALPIQEANDVPYKSRNPGVMHACGHDVHTSSLLGTARILQELKPYFSGTVKLIFQPAEERLPGGASLMIRDGALENPRVRSMFGQHVQPFLDCGKIGIRSGMYMASADEIYLKVKGKGGHAAHPATFIDPITITAQILVALQQVVSRSDPRIPSVLSFGTIRGEGATNIIPSEVYLEGTFRTMNEAWRAQAHEKITKLVTQIADAYGAKAELDIQKGYPVLFNDEALTARGTGYIKDYMGEENVEEIDIWMAAEDFAWYTHEVPGCFYRLGTRNEARGIVHGVHTPQFDIDEDALAISTGLMAWLAVKELESNG